MTEADLIRMENGKKDLPTGMYRTEYNSYRISRRLNGVRYEFGSFRNLEQALRLNKCVSELFSNVRGALKESEDIDKLKKDYESTIKKVKLDKKESIEVLEDYHMGRKEKAVSEIKSCYEEKIIDLLADYREMRRLWIVANLKAKELKSRNLWQRIFNK